ncbi:hypothetical protein EJ02DRAFT_452226 [Clathrospora elynae]|uniref:Uncharacterized protein n=1 Tax=Clathrospora elynae TaxID=706981 RepID=A0A6A5SYZ5_9PLEO|nr:hypothetical protein EJ02DRAFT_452226 [Clathrospora elynae]
MQLTTILFGTLALLVGTNALAMSAKCQFGPRLGCGKTFKANTCNNTNCLGTCVNSFCTCRNPCKNFSTT